MPYVVACKYIQKVIIYFIFSCIRIKFTDFFKIYYVDKKKNSNPATRFISGMHINPQSNKPNI